MIKLQIGDKVYVLSWISARSIHSTLECELKFEETKWRDEVRAMFKREYDRRLRKEWRQFVKFWTPDEEQP